MENRWDNMSAWITTEQKNVKFNLMSLGASLKSALSEKKK